MRYLCTPEPQLNWEFVYTFVNRQVQGRINHVANVSIETGLYLKVWWILGAYLEIDFFVFD